MAVHEFDDLRVFPDTGTPWVIRLVYTPVNHNPFTEDLFACTIIESEYKIFVRNAQEAA